MLNCTIFTFAELLSKASLFANSLKPSQLGRTSTTLANTKECFNYNVLNNGNNHLTKVSGILIL